jgi:hypothetical protein
LKSGDRLFLLAIEEFYTTASTWTARVTDIVEEKLEDEELWEAKDLKIPVYTELEDGISVSLTNIS